MAPTHGYGGHHDNGGDAPPEDVPRAPTLPPQSNARCRVASRLERLVRLASVLESGLIQPSEQIARGLGVSRRTLFRDLAELRRIAPMIESLSSQSLVPDGPSLDRIAGALSRDEAIAFIKLGDKVAMELHPSNDPLSKAIVKIAKCLRNELDTAPSTRTS